MPPGLPVLTARLVPGPEAMPLAGRSVFAFAGIARPEKFFATLEDAGAILVGRRSFPDHHPYHEREISGLIDEAERHAAIPVTTAKDRVRLPRTCRERVRVLSVELVWDDPAARDVVLTPVFGAAGLP